jgi:hypothetical protein
MNTESQSFDQTNPPLRLALVWRGNPKAPDQPTNHLIRLQPLADALSEAGIESKPVIYFDDAVDAIRDQLLAFDGVMAWVDPLTDGQDRSQLDPMLRQVAAGGVWVSAHPDVILKMGTKEVLFRTRELSWSADTHRYETFDAFQEQFSPRLMMGSPRVLKQNRGNGGQGVWKVQLAHEGNCGHSDASDPSSGAAMIVVQAAADDRVEVVSLPEFIERCRPYFSGAGRLIDQAFQRRVGEGMVRCYLSHDQVVGFSEQWPKIKGAVAEVPALGMASAKTMHDRTAARFQELRRMMEESWVPSMLGILNLTSSSLPAIWDADFLLGEPDASGKDTFVLCEINVSSVLPFPGMAADSIARTAARCMAAARQTRRAATSAGK